MKEKLTPTNQNALDALFWREEILQVLYWMEGEELAKSVPFRRLLVLLNTTSENLLIHLKKNMEAGLLEADASELNEDTSVRLAAEGKKEAGNVFRSAFQGLQKAGHGECGPDCEFCYHEGQKLEDCIHDCADSRHQHAHK
ncbi:MAG: hypothetical protein ABIO46_06500 [Chitinophagales bacterium]